MKTEPKYSSTDTKPSRRHSWRFDVDQVKEILAEHLKKSTVVPEGRSFLCGLESDNSRGDGVTLIIDQDL